jgi:hypothetical protein
MAHMDAHEVTESWEERPGAFRSFCTLIGTVALILVIGHAAVTSLAAVARKLLW